MEIAALLRLASDQRLAEHVSAGSERAFEVLYDRHHRPVLAFCRHMLGSREEAEDAVQHTFMAAYRDLLRSGPRAAIRPWLFVIARNRCISILRARREQPAETLPESAVDHLASEVAAREELRAVLAGVARLPDDQRAALVLAELGDISHDEIARILDCRREQVKSYVYLARTSLLADRAAREASCVDIREQLTESRGGQLRRAPLRRHLHACEGCREFREALRGQRRALGVLLPVAPTLALKRAVLGATVGGGGASGLTLGGVAATALMVAAIPAGTVAVAQDSPERVNTTPARVKEAAAEPDRSQPRRRAGARRAAPPRRKHRTTEPARGKPATARHQATPKAPFDHGTPAREDPAERSEPPDRSETATPSPPAPAESAPERSEPPRQSRRSTAPGRSGSAPRQSKRSEPPGRSAHAPGQSTAPGRSERPPPGRSESAPGQDGSPPDAKPDAPPGKPESIPAAEAPQAQGPPESPGRSSAAPGRGRG
jgi:RNA polymerase sigma factor (sigma-70 family)